MMSVCSKPQRRRLLTSDTGLWPLITGRRALRILKSSEKIDVLLSDIVMPGGLNGIQLAEEARRLRPTLKVLLTSGHSAAVFTDKHGLPKAFPVLGKPYRRDQLAANLRELLYDRGA
jgi:DNA-binding NtrC family response regulator